MKKREMEEEIPTSEGLTFEKVWLAIRENDRKFEKWRLESEKDRERDRKEAEKDRKQLEKIIGRLGNKLGEFVEGLVRPGVVRLFNERGLPINQMAERLTASRNGEEMEVDIVGINGKDVIVVEVKSTLGVDDVNEHLQRLEKFKSFFPQYADKQLIGAVAGMVILEGVDKFSYRQGLFVIAQTGETIRLLNDDEFKPKRW